MSFLTAIKSRVQSTKGKLSAIAVLLVMAVLGSLFVVRASAAPVSTPNCDSNAVEYCGASSASVVNTKYKNGDGHNTALSIQNIYKWFGISSSDISSMGTTAVTGSVDRNGDVFAGNTLVATNALTAGRQNIAGSVKRSQNGTVFYTRAPSVSFLDNSLSALVVMKNGVFQFAILTSCGNPVTGTPKKPAYSLTKQVRAAGTTAYSSNVSVKSGTTVQYLLTVKSTGAVPVDNVIIHDALPSDITYKTGTLKENVSSVSAEATAKFFGAGVGISTIKNGTSVTFTFDAVAGKTTDTDSTCKAETLNNEGFITSVGLPNEQSGATVTTTCTPPPKAVLTCDNLTLTPGTADANGNTPYTLTAKGTAQNATITGFVFALGTGQSKTVATNTTTATTTNTYAPGTYTVTASITGTANGTTLTQSSANCVGKITVNAPPQAVVTCNNLTLTAGTPDAATGSTPYTLAATGSAQNATITGYVFTFGDNSQNQTVATGATSANTTHTYAPGSYTPSVSVTATTAAGKTVTVTSANCTGKITIGTPPKAVFTCDELTASPVGSADASGNQAYMLTAKATAQNATITGYNFAFGDGSQPKVVTTGDTTASANHTYAPGTYTAQVTVAVTMADGSTQQVTGPKCNVAITVTPPPATCTSPTTGQKFPVGSAECQPAPTCTSPTGQTFPVGSSECTPTPPTTPPAPTELVNTGPGSIIGIFAAAVIAGFVGHKVILSRRTRRLNGETVSTL